MNEAATITRTPDVMTDQDKGRCAPAPGSALAALKELRDAISYFGGHGMPGFTDRALAYIVMQQADEVLKREMPNAAGEPQPRKPRT